MTNAPRTADQGSVTTLPRTQVDLPSELTAQLARDTIVLDTSAVMADAKAHLAYPGCDVVIPLTVIDELDNNKTRADVAGRNARDFLRVLEAIRLANGGDLSAPVDLPGDVTLRIEPNGLRLDELHTHHLDVDVPDHRILAAALGLKHEGRTVRVVSRDMALRLKASVLELDASEHTPGSIGVHAPHRRGYHTLPLSHEAREAFKGRAPVAIAHLPADDQDLLADVLDNEFIIAEGAALTARRRGNQLVKLDPHASAWGAKARNKEQAFALDLLLDPDVRMTALRGHAGTGKSFLAIAAGLEAVLERATHDRLLILRPMIAVGHQDIGFLPGDIAEKTQPWFAAVVDAMVALSSGKTFQQCSEQLSLLIEQDKVELSPLTFLRGRSLTRTFVILDEAQNIEPGTAKTVISRLGTGSTLVLTGDDGQIDQPFASAVTCGLNVAVDAFAGLDLFGQVFFSKGERSRLADLAAERM